jgi:hypothetical protein
MAIRNENTSPASGTPFAGLVPEVAGHVGVTIQPA